MKHLVSWDAEGLLLRAALLAGYGGDAQPLARRLARATAAGSARSCFEAGTPLQLTVDAPGPPALRVGLRIGDRFDARSIADLVPSRTLEHLARFLEPLPAAGHRGLGTWLFWTEARQSIFAEAHGVAGDLHRVVIATADGSSGCRRAPH